MSRDRADLVTRDPALRTKRHRQCQTGEDRQEPKGKGKTLETEGIREHTADVESRQSNPDFTYKILQIKMML